MLRLVHELLAASPVVDIFNLNTHSEVSIYSPGVFAVMS